MIPPKLLYTPVCKRGVRLLISLLPAIVPGTAENGLINLFDVLEDGRRVLLVNFDPAAMTPGCTTDACDFRDNLARLESQNVSVLGVSKDSLEKLRKFAEHDHLTFPLLSDPRP